MTSKTCFSGQSFKNLHVSMAKMCLLICDMFNGSHSANNNPLVSKLQHCIPACHLHAVAPNNHEDNCIASLYKPASVLKLFQCDHRVASS